MADRPYTLLSCAISLDGYLDSASGERLVLSNDADLDRVDELRAGSDAILVGAATIRTDDPRLLVREPVRRAERVRRGLEPTPVKVTVTSAGRLDPSARFFAAGDGEKLVYCERHGLAPACQRLGRVATLVDAGTSVDVGWVACGPVRPWGPAAHGRGRGPRAHTVPDPGLADELQLAVAPVFVGDSHARRFVDDGDYPWSAERRGTLAEVRAVGDVAVLRYALSSRFEVDHA